MIMDKHAYLIIAHSNLEQLHKLLLLLDDPRNDIYIHLDLKSKLDIKKITPPARPKTAVWGIS